MKRTRIFLLLVGAALLFGLAGCENDYDPTPVDYGRAISGVYAGKLLYGTEIVEDAYVVRLTRVSSSVVSMTARFLGNDSYNFNISKDGNVYSLYSATVYNMTTTISANQMNVTYLTEGGLLFTFTGSKD
ncbi:MAG: hypothetical protein J5871_00690 [Bacteroidales bacterium]|nr:hypothetical protein [Bacteroidales bacterium]